MFEQNYLMRQIKEMIAVTMKMLFGAGHLADLFSDRIIKRRYPYECE